MHFGEVEEPIHPSNNNELSLFQRFRVVVHPSKNYFMWASDDDPTLST
jgi:hypothetical protein